MKVAVIGLGAIGGLVAGYLKEKGIDVIGIGRLAQKQRIEKSGLIIEGVRGKKNIVLKVATKLEEKVDLVIITVKTQDIVEAIKESRSFLSGTTVLSTQNGVRADEILRRELGKENIISSIVMFGSTYESNKRIVHNFEGQWLIGRPYDSNDGKVKEIVDFLKVAFEAVAVENIFGMKWAKVFVNSSNCLPALLGKSMQETYANLDMCKLALNILKEGFGVLEVVKIQPQNMPNFDILKLKGLANMGHDKAASIFSGIMVNLSKEPLYGSVLQSIQRGKASEIDYINGEFVVQAKKSNIEAPLNAKVTELVHKVESTGKFLKEDEILQEMRLLI